MTPTKEGFRWWGDDEAERLREMWLAGEMAPVIAKALDREPTHIWGKARAMGLPARRRWGPAARERLKARERA